MSRCPPRDLAFLHALGFYHVGEALDHARSAEDGAPPATESRTRTPRKITAFLAGFARRLTRRGASCQARSGAESPASARR